MRLSLAPMEGLTGPAYRAAHAAFFGGADRYYTPFLSPTAEGLSKKDLRAVAPFAACPDPYFSSGATGAETVPQVMTNRAEAFLVAIQQLGALGFRTVDLNLGCPSGTVTAKCRGAGFLTVPERLEAFFDTVFSSGALAASGVSVSIKTRIGFSGEEEWPRLLAIYQRYPFSEIIIHPRTRQQLYRGTPHRAAFAQAVQAFATHAPGAPDLVYNGDVFSTADHAALSSQFPTCHSWMLGRGILADPGLFLSLRGQPLPLSEKKRRMRQMHDAMLEANARLLGDHTPYLLARMADLWKYQIFLFEGASGFPRRIRQAGTVSAYRAVVAELFREHDLLPDGAFQNVPTYTL